MGRVYGGIRGQLELNAFASFIAAMLFAQQPVRNLSQLWTTTTDSVAISEAFAFRAGLRVGDDIALPTAGGERHFSICAVFRDYNTGGESVVMSLDRYRRYWKDDHLSGIGIQLTGNADRLRATSAIRALLGNRAVDIRSTEAIVRLLA